MTSVIKSGLMAVSVMVLAGSASASLVTDANGMNGGSPGQWQNTVRLQSSPAIVAVNVDYCVYAPGQFGLSFSGADPTGGTEYVYAYQIRNTLSPHPYPAYKGAVTRFSEGLSGGDEQASHIGSVLDDPNDPNRKMPTAQQLSLQTAGWDFNSPGELKYGYTSGVLFFTSPHSPEMDTGSVTGSMGFYASGQFPSPAPEPATGGLLGAGLIVLAGRKARRRAQ
jgi:hypothetical protein